MRKFRADCEFNEASDLWRSCFRNTTMRDEKVTLAAAFYIRDIHWWPSVNANRVTADTTLEIPRTMSTQGMYNPYAASAVDILSLIFWQKKFLSLYI